MDETAIAGVGLVWSVNGAAQADLAMHDDGTNGDEVAGDDIYTVQIGPFATSTEVQYQVRASDSDGNEVLTPSIPISFQVLEPLVPAADVLLVVDSMWPPDVGFYAPFYTDALDDLDVTFDFWDASLRGFVDQETLAHYLDGVVIWAMPFFGFFNDTHAHDNLASYLDAGGMLFISGQDVAFWNWWRDSFVRDYLHAQYVQDNVGLFALDGTPGDAISDGLRLAISGGDGANNQFFPDEIDALSPAVPILTYDASASVALEQPRLLDEGRILESRVMRLSEDPESEGLFVFGNSDKKIANISSAGTGGLRVDTGTYRVVFFSFGFEAINSTSTRTTVMQRVVDWLRPGLRPICGDQDGDGRVDVSDVIIVLQITVGLVAPTPRQETLGDLNRDGTIDVADAIIGLQYIVGLVPALDGCGPP